MNRKPYPADRTDDQWDRPRPLLPAAKAGTRKGGRPPTDLRAVADDAFYHLRAGRAWRLRPRDVPPWPTVSHHFRAWRVSGEWDRVPGRLREDVRVEAGHPPQPATGRIDSPTVKTPRVRGDRGYDGGGKVTGRKRFVRVDSPGPIWALWVTAAAVQDRDGGRWLLSPFRHLLPRGAGGHRRPRVR